MMGFGPSEARDLSYWEYTAMLTTWNQRHADPDAVQAPDEEVVHNAFAAVMANPKLVN